MTRSTWRRLVNATMLGASALAASLAVGVMVAIVGFVAVEGAAYLNLAFLTETARPLGQPGGGIAHAVVGSAIIVGIAALLAAPVGVGAGVFLAEYAGPRVGTAVRFLGDVLTGVPSVVVGVFVYALIVIHTGFSGFSGGVALAVIMLPIIARTTEEALRLVPREQREAAHALGVPRWRVIASVAVPASLPGIVTGMLLALARAAGETAPLIFTAFGNNFWQTDPTEPVAAMPLVIYRYAISPYDAWHQQAWAAAFILILLVLFINVVARLGTRRRIQ